MPTGGFKDVHDLGTHADVSLIITAFGNSLRLRPEISYARFNVKSALTALGANTSVAASGASGLQAAELSNGAVSSLLGGFANIEIPLGSGGFQPFLLGGLGAVSLKSDATSGPTALSEVKASINLGAGIRFNMGKIGGLIEARINNIPSSDSKAFFKDLRTIPISFGLVF